MSGFDDSLPKAKGLKVVTITKPRPIQWHKCSERMPEIGDEIGIIYDSDFSYMNIIQVTALNAIHVAGKHSHGDSYFVINDITVWAYASDFNFPKDEE